MSDRRVLVVSDADADVLRFSEARAAAWEARALAAEERMETLRRRVAALEERDNGSRVLGPLPLCVCHAIFLLLPWTLACAAARCRAAGTPVCRTRSSGSCATCRQTSGVARRTLALLRAATKRALGTLCVLDVSGFQEADEPDDSRLFDVLLQITKENWRSLEGLRAWACHENVGWTTETTRHFCATFVQVNTLICYM